MYVVDITREDNSTDMLVGNDSMSAKSKTINYVMDYVFANYNINLNKDGSRYIKLTDFENIFMDENKGLITLTEETRRVLRHTPAQHIVVRYNDMTIMYDDMFKVVDKAVYDYAYKSDYGYEYKDLINIGYCPDFPVMAIPFNKWDEFKQRVQIGN